MCKPKHILIIEDDIAFSSLMKTFLESEGFKISVVDNGQDGMDAAISQQPDLTIIDMMLPGLSGIEVCQEIRKKLFLPILMITAQSDEMLEVAALNIGFDDFMTKPIRPHILLARINSLLRRTNNTEEKITRAKQLKAQDLIIDLAKHEGRLNELVLDLTATEFTLLKVMAQRAGEVLHRDSLYQEVHGTTYDGLDRSIDTAISQLRKKLHDEYPPYRYIKTIRGQGYLLVAG